MRVWPVHEAGITSLLFYIVGGLVWLLVADLRRKESRLASNLLELAVGSGNGSTHSGGLSIPFVDSFDLTGVLEKTEKELILRTLTSTRSAGGSRAEDGAVTQRPGL